MGRGLLLLLVLVTVSISPLKTEARQIWLTPLDPVWRSIRNWPANDFMELFEDNAPWQQTASVISGFEISKRFVLEAPDHDLLRVITGLRRRNIALAVQGTPLIASAACGLGVEGHGPPHDMLVVAQRLHRAGADLRYVIFDEPLYYGHEFDGAPGVRPCHAPIGIMAEQAAAKIAELRRIFPGVEVGAVEPFGIPRVDQSVWAADLEEWLKAYALAAGAPLAFLRADVVLAGSEVEKTVGAVGGRNQALSEAGLGILQRRFGARHHCAGIVGYGTANGSAVLPESNGRGKKAKKNGDKNGCSLGVTQRQGPIHIIGHGCACGTCGHNDRPI